jgi:cytochrome c553
MRRAVAGAAACALFAALAACNRQEQQKEVPVPPAQTPPTATAPTETPAANLAMAGSQVASAGVAAAAVPPCTSCHGQQGEGNAAAGFPRLAGQSAQYLQRQLELYASGARSNPVMMPIAHGLSADQRKSVAAYYASLDAPAAPNAPAGADAKVQQRGALLAQIGDESRRVQACGNCHGPGGLGAPPSFPYLAGQNATYLSAALNAWKSGSRNTDASGQMVAIAKGLSDTDIAALSQFFATQAPPKPLDWKRSPAPGGTPAGDAAGPASQTQGAQGVGSEQGLPVTGAGQSSGASDSANPPPQPPQKP